MDSGNGKSFFINIQFYTVVTQHKLIETEPKEPGCQGNPEDSFSRPRLFFNWPVHYNLWSKGRARVHFARVWLIKHPLPVDKIGEYFEVK